jgi:hypothetical protein
MIAPIFTNANIGDRQITDLTRGDAEQLGNIFGFEQFGEREGHR